MAASKKKLKPIHPGEILRLEFLEPMEISAYRLARAIGVTIPRVTSILKGKRAISADTALRLGRFFGMTAEFWTNLQSRYDLEVARDTLGAKLDRVKRVGEVASAPRRRATG